MKYLFCHLLISFMLAAMLTVGYWGMWTHYVSEGPHKYRKTNTCVRVFVHVCFHTETQTQSPSSR